MQYSKLPIAIYDQDIAILTGYEIEFSPISYPVEIEAFNVNTIVLRQNGPFKRIIATP